MVEANGFFHVITDENREHAQVLRSLQDARRDAYARWAHEGTREARADYQDLLDTETEFARIFFAF